MNYVRNAKNFGFMARKGHNLVITQAKDLDEYGETVYLVACSVCQGLHVISHSEFLQQKDCIGRGS